MIDCFREFELIVFIIGILFINIQIRILLIFLRCADIYKNGILL